MPYGYLIKQVDEHCFWSDDAMTLREDQAGRLVVTITTPLDFSSTDDEEEILHWIEHNPDSYLVVDSYTFQPVSAR